MRRQENNTRHNQVKVMSMKQHKTTTTQKLCLVFMGVCLFWVGFANAQIAKDGTNSATDADKVIEFNGANTPVEVVIPGQNVKLQGAACSQQAGLVAARLANVNIRELTPAELDELGEFLRNAFIANPVVNIGPLSDPDLTQEQRTEFFECQDGVALELLLDSIQTVLTTVTDIESAIANLLANFIGVLEILVSRVRSKPLLFAIPDTATVPFEGTTTIDVGSNDLVPSELSGAFTPPAINAGSNSAKEEFAKNQPRVVLDAVVQQTTNEGGTAVAQVVFAPDGKPSILVQYTAPPLFAGTDTFGYTILEAGLGGAGGGLAPVPPSRGGLQSSAIVTVTVEDPNLQGTPDAVGIPPTHPTVTQNIATNDLHASLAAANLLHVTGITGTANVDAKVLPPSKVEVPGVAAAAVAAAGAKARADAIQQGLIDNAGRIADARGDKAEVAKIKNDILNQADQAQQNAEQQAEQNINQNGQNMVDVANTASFAASANHAPNFTDKAPYNFIGYVRTNGGAIKQIGGGAGEVEVTHDEGGAALIARNDDLKTTFIPGTLSGNVLANDGPPAAPKFVSAFNSGGGQQVAVGLTGSAKLNTTLGNGISMSATGQVTIQCNQPETISFSYRFSTSDGQVSNAATVTGQCLEGITTPSSFFLRDDTARGFVPARVSIPNLLANDSLPDPAFSTIISAGVDTQALPISTEPVTTQDLNKRVMSFSMTCIDARTYQTTYSVEMKIAGNAGTYTKKANISIDCTQGIVTPSAFILKDDSGSGSVGSTVTIPNLLANDVLPDPATGEGQVTAGAAADGQATFENRVMPFSHRCVAPGRYQTTYSVTMTVTGNQQPQTKTANITIDCRGGTTTVTPEPPSIPSIPDDDLTETEVTIITPAGDGRECNPFTVNSSSGVGSSTCGDESAVDTGGNNNNNNNNGGQNNFACSGFTFGVPFTSKAVRLTVNGSQQITGCAFDGVETLPETLGGFFANFSGIASFGPGPGGGTFYNTITPVVMGNVGTIGFETVTGVVGTATFGMTFNPSTGPGDPFHPFGSIIFNSVDVQLQP